LTGKRYAILHPGDRQDEFFDRTTKSPVYNTLSIKYDHLPAITYFKPAIADIRYLNVKTYGKKIAYITGAGDKVPEALEQMGYEVIILGNKELAKNNLNQFDAIITGVRAYNTHDWLTTNYENVIKYGEDGGNLIVQ